jgi:RNA polymerase sigma-70 factor (ECF subfamily)
VVGRPLDDTDADDADLVDRTQRGDVDAYAVLVRRHQAVARRLAYVLCGSSEDADDAVQDAMVKGYRAIGRFRSGAPFRAWLLRIVANEARNRRRAAGRRNRQELRLATDRTSEEAAPSPEAAVLATERRRRTLNAVAALPDRHRDVVACRYLLGLSEAETAAVLGLARGTVKSRGSRALARLRTDLGTSDGV